MKIYFLTRSMAPYQNTGGGLIRKAQVDFFVKKGDEVTVIMPNYISNDIRVDNNIIQIPFTQNIRFAFWLERLGFYEDYLDNWVKRGFDYLKNKITEKDIIFATCGGELASIKLGSLLKEKTNCKFVVNFHDPLDYTNLNGLRLDKKFHINRDKYEKKYLKNSDFIFTSSNFYKDELIKKYPELTQKTNNHYFGYIKKNKTKKDKTKKDKVLRVAYVGEMGNLQKPEYLFYGYEKIENKTNIEIYFIGDYENYAPFKNIKNKNVFFVKKMAHQEFLTFMSNIDVGFVSLTDDYLGLCVPSKLYEYINLEIPILASVPKGDAYDIVKNNKYGISFFNGNYYSITKGIEYLQNPLNYKKIKENIIKDKNNWFLQELMLSMYLTLKNIH